MARKKTRHLFNKKKHLFTHIAELGKMKVGLGLFVMAFSLLTVPVLVLFVAQSGSLTDLRNRAAYSDAPTNCTPSGRCQESGKLCCDGNAQAFKDCPGGSYCGKPPTGNEKTPRVPSPTDIKTPRVQCVPDGSCTLTTIPCCHSTSRNPNCKSGTQCGPAVTYPTPTKSSCKPAGACVLNSAECCSKRMQPSTTSCEANTPKLRCQ